MTFRRALGLTLAVYAAMAAAVALAAALGLDILQ